MKVLAVCTGTAQPIAAKSGLTGHFKTPQPDGAQFNPLGLVGDTIVDTDHHGGPDQAVYVFTETDRLWWQTHLARPTPAGYFGENLLIDAPSSATLALGDIFEVGETRLQITSPRIPCVTFNARIGSSDGVNIFRRSGRPGAYARVLTPGHIRPNDPITHRPHGGEQITIGEHFTQWTHNFQDPDYLRRTLTVPAHAELIAHSKALLDR